MEAKTLFLPIQVRCWGASASSLFLGFDLEVESTEFLENKIIRSKEKNIKCTEMPQFGGVPKMVGFPNNHRFSLLKGTTPSDDIRKSPHFIFHPLELRACASVETSKAM